MSLIAGSYERFIWGYKLKTRYQNPETETETETKTLTLAQQFSYAAHLSPITTVAISTPSITAASAAADDTVKLYDLATSTELGSLLLHTSSATTLKFYSTTNLIAGANNGSIHIIDVDPLCLLKSVKVHKKAVNSVAVHESGRVSLSVARDGRLGMVNLVRGKKCYFGRLEKQGEIVEYFSGGGRFFMSCGDTIAVHDSEDAKLLGVFRPPKRILCAAPAQSGLIFTGGEDRGITAWDSVGGKVAYNIENAHNTRVKGIVVLSRNRNSDADENPFLVASASSDGVIRVWDVRATSKEKPVPLSEANTKSRLTCLAGSSIKSLKLPQAKKDAPENNAEEMQDS